VENKIFWLRKHRKPIKWLGLLAYIIKTSVLAAVLQGLLMCPTLGAKKLIHFSKMKWSKHQQK